MESICAEPGHCWYVNAIGKRDAEGFRISVGAGYETSAEALDTFLELQQEDWPSVSLSLCLRNGGCMDEERWWHVSANGKRDAEGMHLYVGEAYATSDEAMDTFLELQQEDWPSVVLGVCTRVADGVYWVAADAYGAARYDGPGVAHDVIIEKVHVWQT